MKESFSLTIDGRSVEVQPGESVLTAARKLGVDIPTLCYLEKCGPLNTCQVCLVKLNGRLVPSCGTKVEPGMAIESDTEEVHEARRTALEAALAAARICRASRDYVLPSHLSAEPGHAVVLRALELEPIFELDMRLGEGTGAALAMGVIDAACRVLSGMATFAEAGVDTSES